MGENVIPAEAGIQALHYQCDEIFGDGFPPEFTLDLIGGEE